MRSPEDAFDLAGLARLRREAADLADRLSSVDGRVARFDGFDASRTVRVTIDGSARAVDVEVGRSWRDAIDPGRLGAAVVEAADDAQRRYAAQWSQAAERPPARGATSAAEPSTADGGGAVTAAPSPTDLAVTDATRELYYLAMDVMDRLTEVGRTLEQAPAGAARGTSPGGRVTVRVEAGRVVGVEMDPRWLERASHEAVAEQVRAALAAAYRADSRTAVDEAITHPTFRELREVTGDPQELLRRLGLIPRG